MAFFLFLVLQATLDNKLYKYKRVDIKSNMKQQGIL